MSFGKFARFFRDRLKAPERASTSTGRSARCGTRPTGGMDAHAPLGPMIVAFKTRGVSAWSRRPRQTLSACTVSGTSWTRIDLRALLGRLERQREAPAEPLVGRRFVRQRADRPLAAGAEHERAAEPVEQRQAVHQLEIVRDGLAEAEAGIDEDLVARDAGRLRRGDPLLEPVDTPRPARRRSAGRPASSAGRPGGASARPARPAAATTSAERGSKVSAETSLTSARRRRARPPSPPPCGCRSTPPRRPPRAAGRPARTRSISSPSHTGLAPGRVDSPPTSMIAAPAAAMSAPAVGRGAARRRYAPPSEKLSGVTLRMPITCGWSSRMVRSPSCSGGRGDGQRCPVGGHARRRSALRCRSTGTSSADPPSSDVDQLDRGEPVQPAGQPRDLAVMAERRIDEAGRAEEGAHVPL